MSTEHRIIAVVSVFHAPDDLRDRMLDVLDQVDAIVLVDDGSDTLETIEFGDDRIHTVSSPTNRGIAAALNTAVNRARELGATHVVTLDQDSALAPDHVARLLATLERSQQDGAIVAAAVPGVVGGAPILYLPDGQPFDPIQSGQVVPMATFDRVGLFNEDLFIDAVDSDFTVRAVTMGMEFRADRGLHMAHELGELVPLKIFGRHLVLGGKPRHVLYHSPARTYYMVRNSLWLAQTYRDQARDWTRLRNRKLWEMVIGGSLLAPDRAVQLRAIRWGRRDARRGVLGRIPAEVQARLR